MFKNFVRLLLLIFFTSVVGSSYATEYPDLKEKEKKVVKGDSLTVQKDEQAAKAQKQEVVAKPVLKKENPRTNYYGHTEDEVVKEDTTSNSALSFNFIYYIIEKFKFQVE